MPHQRERLPWPERSAHCRHLILLAVIVAVVVTPTRAAEVSPELLLVDGQPLTHLVPAQPGAVAVFACGAHGFYRLDPAASTWQRVGDVPPAGHLVSAIDAPDLLLAGDHPPCARGGDPISLHRSEDGGGTWQRVAGADGVRPLAMWASVDLALGAGCAGLAVSTDRGVTWQPLNMDSTNFEITAFASFSDPTRPGGLVAATSEGGSSRLWILDLQNPDAPVLSDVLREFWGHGALASDQDTVLLGASVGVAVSTDAGKTWTLGRTGLEAVTIRTDPRTEGLSEADARRRFGINVVAFSPDDPQVFHVGTVDGLFTSSDGGANWVQTTGIVGPITEIVITAGMLFVQTESGVVMVPLLP